MIDYKKESKKYRPQLIKTLLIGEAPPPNQKTYFYVPKKLSLGRTIEDDTSLPSTIFNHYFHRRPENIEEYEEFLIQLKEDGIFLIDIIDEPIPIRGNKENENYLITQIPKLKDRMNSMNINVDEEKWIFLLARNSYKKYLNNEYPKAKKIRWKDFRLHR